MRYLRGTEGRPGEAALLRKIDFFILTFCCLMYFANYVSLGLSLIPSNGALDRLIITTVAFRLSGVAMKFISYEKS